MSKKYQIIREMKDSEIEWMGEIPREWGISRLRFLCKITTGNKDTVDKNPEGKYPFFVRSPKIEKIETYSFDGEAILTAGDGDVGKIFHHIIGKFDFHQRVYCFYEFNKVYPRYIYYHMIENFRKEVEKGTAKTTVESLRLPMLKEFKVPLPTYKEQKIISDYLDEKVFMIDSLIEEQKVAVEQWKKYKQTLITESVTKGLNPDVQMKDSGIEWLGKIPNNWCINKLRYLGNCKNGISKSAQHFGYGFPFISYSDIYRNIVIPNEIGGLVDSSEEERNLYSVQEGDVFFTRTSETKEEIGLSSVCLKTIPEATFAGFVIRFRPLKGKLDKNFSKYYFRGSKHRLFFIKEMNVITRASLGQNLLKNLPVLLPPLDEQKQIAEFLDNQCIKIDKAIEQKQVLIKQLEEYKQSLIYECVTGKKQLI